MLHDYFPGSVLCAFQGANSTLFAVIFGIEEAVKEAQNGGSGVVIYFRKEGRALGEVTKVSIMYPLPPCDWLTWLQYRKCHRCSEIFPAWLSACLGKGGTTAGGNPTRRTRSFQIGPRD